MNERYFTDALGRLGFHEGRRGIGASYFRLGNYGRGIDLEVRGAGGGLVDLRIEDNGGAWQLSDTVPLYAQRGLTPEDAIARVAEYVGQNAAVIEGIQSRERARREAPIVRAPRAPLPRASL